MKKAKQNRLNLKASRMVPALSSNVHVTLLLQPYGYPEVQLEMQTESDTWLKYYLRRNNTCGQVKILLAKEYCLCTQLKYYLRRQNAKKLLLTIGRNGCQPTSLPQTWTPFLLQSKNLLRMQNLGKQKVHMLLRRQTS